MILTPGTRLGPYEILAPLGAGGMGEVWKAKDTRLDRFVAVKVLPEHLAKHPESMARFEREAKAVAALNHPNILGIHDFATQEDTTYVVMELLEGESLRTRLESGPLPPRKAIELAIQIAHGLAAAHEKGVVHRDLKPDNLWITKDGRLKILDFGLAKQLPGMKSGSDSFVPTAAISPGHHTEKGMILGTLGYMSPEQVRGEAVDARSDIFSFGAVLFEMLTGKRAFARDTASDTMAAILRDDPPDLAEMGRPIQQGLRRVLDHCLEKNPAHRFRDVQDLAFALENLDTVTSGPQVDATDKSHLTAFRNAKAWRALPWLVALALALVAFWPRGSRGIRGPSGFRQLNLRTEAIFRAAFAPDGQTIVYSAAREGNRPELFVVRPDSPVPQPLGFRDTHLLNISSTGDMAVLIQARYIHHQVFTGTLARVHVGGGAPREILENVREADWFPDGSRMAIIRDVNGKDHLEGPIGTVLHASAGYLSDMRVSPQGNQLACFEHPIRWDDRGAVLLVDMKGESKVLADGFEALEGLAWSPDGREILFSATYAGVNNMSLYAVDLSGNKRLIYESPGGITIQDFHRTGRWLTTRDDNVSAVMAHIDGAGKDRDLSWLEGSYRPFLSRDGRSILFSDFSFFSGASYAVCMRSVDGSPVIRLGEGDIQGISRDGKWVLSHLFTTPGRLMIYPTGAGEPRRVELGNLEPRGFACWLRDGSRILVGANEPGRGPRCYLVDLRGGVPRPLTPEGIIAAYLSPDERWLLTRNSGGAYALLALDGGEPRPVQGLDPVDQVIQWSADGRSVLAFRGAGIPCHLERVNVENGRREPFCDIAPSDLTGLKRIMPSSFSDDERSYVYQVNRMTSKLFASESLK